MLAEYHNFVISHIVSRMSDTRCEIYGYHNVNREPQCYPDLKMLVGYPNISRILKFRLVNKILAGAQ